MARGFESKDVEFQQAEATRPKTAKRTLTPAERETSDKRHSIELALAKTRAEFASATNPAHRRMLENAIEVLLEQLNDIPD
jgi:hypothetical protein